jgi:hypothetical protein
MKTPKALRLSMSTPLTGKLGPEHRETALRLGFGCFVLQDIPVFGEHAVGHSDNIGGDPIPGPSSSRKPAMDETRRGCSFSILNCDKSYDGK